jgi:hypothetical protein
MNGEEERKNEEKNYKNRYFMCNDVIFDLWSAF